MKTKPYLTSTAVVAICFCIALTDIHTFAREFTSSDGKKIEAEIVTVRDTEVVIKCGSRQYTVPVTRFSLADQDYMREWKKKEAENLIPKLKVKINSRKSDRSDRQDYFDDRKGSFQMSVTITNEELSHKLEDYIASVAVIGEDCENSKKYGIMQKSTFKINLEPGEVTSWKGAPMLYKFDDNAPAIWGVKYYGYVLQIRNAKGKVVYETATQKKFESKVDKILSFGVKQAFDKSMREREQIHIHEL